MFIVSVRPVYTPRSGRPNRGPRKQVFVCGVAERSGPVRQDISRSESNKAAHQGLSDECHRQPPSRGSYPAPSD
jgi:hypothetical protein